METQTKTNIGTASAVILAIAAIVLSAGLIGQDNVYVCEYNDVAMQCDSLSKINADGIQTRCYYEDQIENRTRYKNCKTGWLSYEPVKTEPISINFSEEDPLYLVCLKTSPIISECKVLESDSIVYKKEN